MEKDIAEVAGCICLRLRRTTRRVTQIYDDALAPAGLTVNQFGVLANLLGVTLAKGDRISIGELAERLGMDASTLSRTLKPLKANGLIKEATDPEDLRLRLLAITDKGRLALQKAFSYWRGAQALVRTSLGAKTAAALTEALDHSDAKLPQ